MTCGCAEDLAGVTIVLIILASALVAGYESVRRLMDPQPVAALGRVAAAGIIGFIGNEVVAVLRIRVGREIDSAALIADGYHARTDGLTSLAVVVGAVGVWLGFPLADPIVGLLITVAIFGIVWQSARSVLTRTLDGVEPGVTAELRHAAEHVPGIGQVVDVRARWLGHRLQADVVIAVADDLRVADARAIAGSLERELFAHLPALGTASVRLGAPAATDGSAETSHSRSRGGHGGHAHHHAPEPLEVRSELARGMLEIVDTPDGERMRLTLTRRSPADLQEALVVIERPGLAAETLALRVPRGCGSVLQSLAAPAEPHEFSAELRLRAADGRAEILPFRMVEPATAHDPHEA